MVTPRRSVAMVIGLVVLSSVAWPPGSVEAQPGPSGTAKPATAVNLYGDPLPPGAVLRLGTVKYRQDSPIDRIAYLADGEHFVTDGEDSTLRLWDATKGRVVRRVDPGVGAVEDYAIARRGDLVMVAGKSLEPSRGYVQNVAFIHLFTGRIEDRGSWPDEPGGVKVIGLCPERRLVAMGAASGGVRVLDARNGAEVCRFGTGELAASRIVFSPDGKRLAVETNPRAPADREIILRIYDLERKQELRVVREGGVRYSDLIFSPDGSAIAAPTGVTLSIWEIASGRRIAVDKPFVRSVGYSADGRTLAGIASFGLIKVFEPSSGKTTASRPSGIDHVDEVTLAPDGRTLLMVGGKQAIHAWDIEAGRDRFALPDSHVGPARTLLFTPDGKALASGGADETVRLWDLGTGKQSRMFRLSGPAEAAGLSPDGRRMAAATFIDHQVFAWDLSDRGGPIVLNYATGEEILTPLAMRFLDADTILLIDAAGDLHRLDVKGRRVTPGVELKASPPDPKFHFTDRARFTSAAFLPGGERVALLGLFSGLHVLELATGREVLRVGGGRHLIASPDGRILAVSETEFEGDEKLRRSRSVRHTTGVNIAPVRGEILLVDAETGKQSRRIAVQGSEVWAMAFSPDGRTLAATSGWETGRIHFYDVASGRETHTIDCPPLRSPALAFTPDGSRLVSGMAEGSILVWDVRPDPSVR